jgi:hypothetical protein
MSMAWYLRVKFQALTSQGGRRRRHRRFICGCCLEEPALVVVCVASLALGVGRRQGSRPGWWLCVELAASGSMVGSSFTWQISYSHELGDSFVSPGRQGRRLSQRALEESV